MSDYAFLLLATIGVCLAGMVVFYACVISDARQAIKTFNRDIEQFVLFKPSVIFNNKLYLIDKIKRWHNDENAGNWLVAEHSHGDIITEFTVDKNKFIAIYKQADDEK